MTKPLVSIIIPTRNRSEQVIKLLKSINASNFSKTKIEIIVVDDCSKDSTIKDIRNLKYSNVNLIVCRERQYCAKAKNIGAAKATAKYLFFVDDDNVLEKECINRLVEYASSNPHTILAPVMLYYKYPKKIWSAGCLVNPITYKISYLLQNKLLNKIKNKYILDATYFPNSFFIKKDDFEKIGNFDGITFPMSWQETDFFFRAKKKNFQCVTLMSAILWHDVLLNEIYHITQERMYFRARSRIRFYQKYASWRILFVFIDILGFVIFTLSYVSNKEKRRILFAYLNGILDGILKKPTEIK